MPQSSYSNKDLKRFDRTPGNYTEYDPYKRIVPEDVPGTYEPSADELLGDAHEAITRANLLEQQTGADDIATLPQRMNALRSAAGELPNARRDIRNLTEKLHTAGAATGLAAIPGSIVGAGPLLGAAGLALMAPDVARRIVLPDEDESRLGGVGEAALMASPLALKGLKTAAGAIRNRSLVAAEGLARQEEAAKAAGRMSEMRMMGRNMDEAGFSPDVTQQVTGLHPKAPRSISTATPISHNVPNDYIGDVMDEAYPDKYVRFSTKAQADAAQPRSNSFQGLLDAVNEPQIEHIGGQAENFGEIPLSGAQAEPSADEVERLIGSMRTVRDPLAGFAAGEPITSGQGGPQTPEMAALFQRWLQRGEGGIENLNSSVGQFSNAKTLRNRR